MRNTVPPLELATFEVHDIAFREGASGLHDHVLTVDPKALGDFLQRDPRLDRVDIDLARPGESVRIVHILDVVEPRVKVGGGQSAFPGWTGSVTMAGRGRTARLGNVAVVQTVHAFWVHDGLSVKEAIVDMSGPAAAYSPFAQTLNVVIGCRFRPELSVRQRGEAAATAVVRAAEYLARIVDGGTPDRVDTWDFPPASLPRVAYLCFLMHEGDVHRSYVYGSDVPDLPTALHPTEVIDGAIVAGDYHTACFRNVTYLQQNNPVLRALMRRHGRDLEMAGVIVARALAPQPSDKSRIAQHCATLAELVGAEGVVVSQDSGGNATVDLMRACTELEHRGVQTVLIAEELAGPQGIEEGLVHYAPEATAMVSTGNRDELLRLPAMERALGGDRILNPDRNDTNISGPAGEAFETSLRRILCATSQVGPGRLSTELW